MKTTESKLEDVEGKHREVRQMLSMQTAHSLKAYGLNSTAGYRP